MSAEIITAFHATKFSDDETSDQEDDPKIIDEIHQLTQIKNTEDNVKNYDQPIIQECLEKIVQVEEITKFENQLDQAEIPTNDKIIENIEQGLILSFFLYIFSIFLCCILWKKNKFMKCDYSNFSQSNKKYIIHFQSKLSKFQVV